MGRAKAPSGLHSMNAILQPTENAEAENYRFEIVVSEGDIFLQRTEFSRYPLRNVSIGLIDFSGPARSLLGP